MGDDWIIGDYSSWNYEYVACEDVFERVFPEAANEETLVVKVTEEPHDNSRAFTYFKSELADYLHEGETLIHKGYLYGGLRKILPDGETRYVSLV
jgi:hypothetical protein